MSNLELLDRAASATTCQILNTGGQALVGVGTVGIVTGGVGMVPLTAGAAMLLASNYACSEMPLGGTPPVPGVDGCQKIEAGGWGQLQWRTANGLWQNLQAGDFGNDAIEITNTDVSAFEPGRGYASLVFFNYRGGSAPYGWTTAWFTTEEEARGVSYRIVPISGSCAQESDDLAPLPDEITQPISYTDSVTNCNFNLTLQGFAEPVPGGPVRPVYLIQQQAGQRTEGGRMGGCNWPDTIYMPGGGDGGGGGGDGPVYLPVPDGPTPPDGPGGVPWWAGPLLAGSTAAALNQIGNAINDLLGPTLPAGDFTLQAPCDIDEEGNPLTQTWTFPQQKVQERMIAHQITQLEALQAHLNWKTPICSQDEKPELEGDFRTISFRSDETSPYGKSRLRKRFRYRSTSGFGLSEVVSHWADFTFEAGSVCVIHSGSSWGTPQVWAATADEGKRVIRHAAGEAGIDPDQVGRWTISGSDSPRVGVSGTMRVDTTGGYYWITARDGSNSRPVVALT